jgi:hypothetical protein
VNENRVNLFTLKTNDTNFFITTDTRTNTFRFNFRGKLFYNINNAHRYVVEVTAYDSGVPQRSSKALFFVPLINYNVNPPSFTDPVILVAAITFPEGQQLGILNAWDIDGDVVSFSLDPTSNSPTAISYIDVLQNGTVLLKKRLTSVQDSFNFVVLLTDDGSSCDASNSSRISLQSKMTVTLKIIDINMYSPQFVPNTEGKNYCQQKYQAYENSKFRIEIVAQDDDPREPNGKIMLRSPDLTDRSPQYSFKLISTPQKDRKVIGYVENIEEFDYENPKYGSNTLNLMFYAEDQGLPKRVGYCFMSIDILDVNDNIPVFAQQTYSIFIHEQYKTRQFTYRFSATDKDSGLNGTVEYFMDTKNYPIADRLFSLSKDGTLTVRNASCLDELTDRLMFEIYAEDLSPTRNRSQMVTVYIIKSNLKLLPPFFVGFPEPAVIDNVSEMIMRGSLLRSFPVQIQSKTDPGQFLRCFLSPKPNPEWFKFEADYEGNLSRSINCNLKVEDPLNYRVASTMVIYMIAELGSNAVSSTARELKLLTINLKEENINPPKFVSSKIEASVVESSEDVGKVVAVVKAYDIDKTSPNNLITYSFQSRSDQTISNDGYFEINPRNGEIKLRQPIQNSLTISMTVWARDGTNGFNSNKPNENSIYVDFKVIDINDNPPVFSKNSYSFSIRETEQPGFVIGRLEVMDQDTHSYFNYSISNPTFGIRGIYDTNKQKAHSHYRGSAEIYLNNYLDYRKIREYEIFVYVSDSQFVTPTKVTIKVLDELDRPPKFDREFYEVSEEEEKIPLGPIATLRAIKNEVSAQDDSILFEVYSTPYLNKDAFDLNTETGELRLLKGLNRDLPNGRPEYLVPVSCAYSRNPQLKSFAYVRIKLMDINDNAPYLVYGINRPLIIDEETNSGSVEMYVVDVDSPENGKPFTFTLLDYQSLFSIQPLACPNCPDRERYQLVNRVPLKRIDQKFYSIPYLIKDKGDQTRNGSFELIVGDINNNIQMNGTKQVKILRFENKLQPDAFLGTLYLRDLDDWDLRGKQAGQCMQNTGSAFEIRNGLRIIGPRSFEMFPRDNMNLQCVVNDPNQSQQPSTATARVDFSLDNIEYADTIDLAGIRVLGKENFTFETIFVAY